MKLISLKCPECNANLQIEEGHDKCYCQYCGAEITINDYSSSQVVILIEKLTKRVSKRLNIGKKLESSRLKWTRTSD